MERNVWVLTIVLAVFALGCETVGEGTKKGAGVGGLTGAAIGGVVGHQSGRGWEGALIGGAAGATAGGLIGNQADKTNAANFIPVTKIVEMAQQGVPESVIIDEIKRTKSKYQLSSETITYLKNNGVTDNVINVMLNK